MILILLIDVLCIESFWSRIVFLKKNLKFSNKKDLIKTIVNFVDTGSVISSFVFVVLPN